MKPHLRVVADERTETPLEAARRRYGKKFAHERGSRFVWKFGPTVLGKWLQERKANGR